MHASLLTTRYTRFALLVFLPLVVFVSGCGDAGNINPNLPDTGVVGPTGSTAPTGPPSPTGVTGPPGDPEAVVINEIFPEASQIELHNPGTAPADISGFWLCHTTPFLVYAQMPDNTIIQPGGFLIVNWGISGTDSGNEIFTFPAAPFPLGVPNGEVAFYVPFPFSDENFADSALIRDYVQWGEADNFRQIGRASGRERV